VCVLLGFYYYYYYYYHHHHHHHLRIASPDVKLYGWIDGYVLLVKVIIHFNNNVSLHFCK
jgi:hypothetical protein